jgi:NDP-sugar pyrophosphorylase family protein
MKFAIIAAGDGSRFKKEGILLPKPLVAICGKPMIEYIFEYALLSGAESIHCIINEQSQELKEYIESKTTFYPVNLIIKSTLSSMHSLYELSGYMKDDSFCLSTVDTIFDEGEFMKFINYTKQSMNLSGVIAVTGFIDDEKPLYVKTDKNEYITEFSDVNNDHELITGGLYYFKSGIYDTLERAVKSGSKHLRNFLKMLILDGHRLKSYKFLKMIDIDHRKDIETAEEFLNKTKKEPYLK